MTLRTAPAQSHNNGSVTSPPFLPAAGLTFAVAGGALVLGGALLLRHAYHQRQQRRVGPRIKTIAPAMPLSLAAAAPPAEEGVAAATAATVLWQQQQKPAGVMDRWFQSQPPGEKRHFVVAARLRGVAPTRLELQAALTRVAAAHPRLLMLPHPSEFRIHSQLPALATQDDGSVAEALPFPLPLLSGWVEEPVEWAGAPGSADALRQLEALIGRVTNEPVDDDPPAELCAEGCRTQAQFRTVRLHCLRSSAAVSATDPAAAAAAAVAEGSTQDTRVGDEFALVLHLAHQFCDGQSGLVLLRHLLSELAVLRAATATGEPLPQQLPLSSFRPLCEYPAMDDLLDMRPPQWRLDQLRWAPIAATWRKRLGLPLPLPWWDGTDERLTPGQWSSRCSFVQLPATALAQLAQHAKRNGCTVQAALHCATAFAAGVASGRASVRLLTGTSVSFRPLCEVAAPGSAAGSLPPRTPDLLDNFVGLFVESVELDAAPCHWLASWLGRPQQRVWGMGRGYLRRLQAGFPLVQSTLGLLALFNARYVVRGQAQPLRNQRSSSVVVSNLGLADGVSAGGAEGPLSAAVLSPLGFALMDLRFAQTATYVHGLFVCSVVSSAVGGLQVAVTSPTRVVSDEQAQRFDETLRTVLDMMARGEDADYAHVRHCIQQRETGP